MSRCLVLLCLASYLTGCLFAQQAPKRIAATFARAGDNRAELERAWQQVEQAQRSSLAFLLTHLTDADARSLSAQSLLLNVRLAHAARARVGWGSDLSDELFCNYVLPHAQANEAREAWRSSMVDRFLPLVLACETPGEAARKLNETIFDLVNVHYSTERRRADQAPSESIAQGKASCTGLSILLADACRACCVPARMISVRWPHKRGNHTWVEIWDGSAWRFVGADEPDPNGLDRAWFVGDAKRCREADRAHRIWAVSFAATGERFGAGWGRAVELWGTDETARYAPVDEPVAVVDDATTTGSEGTAPAQDAALLAQFRRYFAAAPERQATFEFDRNLDRELMTKAGDARLRKLAWQALRATENKALLVDHRQNRVTAGGKTSPFTIKEVGEKPVSGWPLVIAMHGGGGVAKRVNDSQWRHMQVYYKDHPEAGGYLYCALRAPTDAWNGFYTDYFYPVIEKLIRQFVVCREVDPDRIIAIGYSHGGYGAFAVGPKLPHRFAAVHASAAAPTGGLSSPIGLHTLRFSFMVGGLDKAYGRRPRCEEFDRLLAKLKKQHPGQYPTTFTLVEGNGHGGLPDRDLLPKLLPLTRASSPKQLRWRMTDSVIEHHYWLHVAEPKSGMLVSAALDSDAAGGQQLVWAVGEGVRAEVWLDARLIDLSRDLEVVGAGADRHATPAPSLRTLCHTLQQRGDPQLAASWVLPLN